MLAEFASAFATLFVIVDPIGLTPIFAALTAGASTRARAAIALRAVLVAACLLAGFALAGDALLRAIGISLPAFRIAGGLMLFLVAVDMLFETRKARREKRTESEPPGDDPSVFPLATPLLAGPGAMATMILLASADTPDSGGPMLYLAMLSVLALCFVAFLATGPIERAIGPMGINVLTRVFGTLLGALAVQFVLDGLSAWSRTMA